jgi:hypothetical protein
MKITAIFVAFILSALVSMSTDVEGQVRQPDNVYILGIDSGGVNLDAELGFQVRVEAMRVIRSLRTRVRYVRSRIELVDITEGRLVWAGTPGTFRGREADKVTQVISSKPTRCSDLVRGFQAIQDRVEAVEKMGFNKISILIFSPLIHTGTPCAKSSIKLPQAPPAYNFAASLIKSVKTKLIAF